MTTLQEIARSSYFDNGPLLAREYVEKHGMHVTVAPRLPKTCRDGLIPGKVGDRKPTGGKATVAEVYAPAAELKLHPATIAGRIRHEKKNYKLLSRHVGSKQIRKHFAASVTAAA